MPLDFFFIYSETVHPPGKGPNPSYPWCSPTKSS